MGAAAVLTGPKRVWHYGADMERQLPEWRPQVVMSENETRKLEIAKRQVEWAETYLFAIVNLDLEDVEARRLVHEMRDDLRRLEARLLDLTAR